MDTHEKLRLLYVACTRARDHLIVSCHHKADDGSFASIVWNEMSPWPDARLGAPEWLPDVSPAEAFDAPAPPDEQEWARERDFRARHTLGNGAGHCGFRPSSTATTSRTTQLMWFIAGSVRLAKCGYSRTLASPSNG